jgi:GR25 family glycosyltransferase involved in LPS biosynthesis
MECFFINLDSQVERRDFLRGNFSRHKAQGWFLNRIPAIGVDHLALSPAPGLIRETEKACFLSHKLALRESLEAPGHALILEDDALFGPSSCGAIDNAVASLAPDGWDLLYTDLSIYHPPLMAGMLHMRREAAASGGQVLLDARELTFCGATAYIVQEGFKERLLELLECGPLDRPYDAYLRDLIVDGQVRGHVAFPFPTSLSAFADSTQIQVDESKQSDRVFNSFRRFIWLDRDLASATEGMEILGADFADEESATFARIMGAAFSNKIKLG